MPKNISVVILALLGIVLPLQAENWKSRKLPRPIIFAQGQWIYSLNPWYNQRPYFSEWTDWPLFIDSNLKEEGVKARLLQYPDYARIQDVIQLYGLDGIGFWEQHSRMKISAEIIDYSARSRKKDFYLIPYVSSTSDFDKDLTRINDSNNILRIDGKKVLWSYRSTDEQFAQYKKMVEDRHPGNFLFIMNKKLPERFLSTQQANQDITAEDREFLKEEVRKSLRQFDGFGWWDFCQLIKTSDHRRVLKSEFLRNLLALTREVFDEPQFKDKIFVSEALVGHENASWLGYLLSSEGTKTLRESLLAALEAGADIINIPEWDEQCENTSLRPTVYNGTAHLRIMRYITGKLKGNDTYMLPGDNLEVPNLVLSMRKIITLGEKLEFELLNIPDRADDDLTYSIRLVLRNIHNEIIHEFEPLDMQSGKLMEHRPAVPSEKFASERVLIPELIISRGENHKIFREGLSVVQIQPTWNFDYKWVKQPLRDLMEKPKISFSIAPTGETSVQTATVSVSSPQVLNFVELLDNGDCIYSAIRPGDNSVWRENDEELAFSIYLQSVVYQPLSGSVTLSGTTPRWKPPFTDKIEYEKNKVFNEWHRGGFVAMPRSDIDKAYFEIDFPGQFTGKVPVKDVVDNLSVILGGKKGFNIAITRQLRQFFHPENLNLQDISFQTAFSPDLKVSVMQLQLIAPDGKIWRSAPLLTAPPAANKKEAVVFSETLNKPVKVTVPTNLIPNLHYEWGDAKGLIVPVDAGRTLWGVRGGYIDLATLRVGGYGNSSQGTPPTTILAQVFWKNSNQLAPTLEKLPDGRNMLYFSGDGEHIAFPTGTIPRRAAFTIQFSIKPINTAKKQFILSNRSNAPGLLQHIFLENGTLQGLITNDGFRNYEFNSGIALKENEWNTVKIIYDQTTILFVVNGVVGKRIPAPGPGPYDVPLMLGTWGEKPFTGWIGDLSISHFISPF